MSRGAKERRAKGAGESVGGPLDFSKASCGSSMTCPRLYDEDWDEPPRCFGSKAAFDPEYVARAYANSGPESEEFPHGTKWADACVFEMQSEHPWEALEIIRLAAHAAKTDFKRCLIGAGHLESLLANHGPLVISEVERLARQDPLFKECLMHVWQHGMAKDLFERVLVASGRQKTDKS